MGNEMDLSSIAESDYELYSSDSIYGPKPQSILSTFSVSSNISQQAMPKSLEFKLTRSLPNLTDEPVAEKREFHSNSDAKNEDKFFLPDERRGLNTRTRSKAELNSRDKQIPGSKIHGSNQDSSSGYLSANYAMDSISSSNRSQISTFSRTSIYEIEESWITNGEFPERCFKKLTYTSEGKIYDPAKENLNLLNSKQRRIKLALKRYNYDVFYVSSTEFMKHFQRLFKHHIGNSLGFDQETVDDVRREGCVLYCSKIIVYNSPRYSRVEQYEIIPAVSLQWPSCAQEWLDRPRNNWPDYNDVDKMKDFGCYVVPEGYVSRNGNNNISEDLEWQLTFPTAERYLETCMTQAQLQVYLITLMLHKTFMKPIFDTIFGLTPAHIKHKLFWMIEEENRPSKWPDNAMGERLMTLLYSLYHDISQNEPTLRDYFIRGRNLFQRTPAEHLLHTQKQLKRITENPVMYVFHAMESMTYSDDFYPKLDFKMLLKILTADTLSLVNPTLTQNVSRPMPRPQEERFEEENKYGTTRFWDTVKRQNDKHSKQIVTNKTLINARKATDSIIEISVSPDKIDYPKLSSSNDTYRIEDACRKFIQFFPSNPVFIDI